jgi:hypothetical protein
MNFWDWFPTLLWPIVFFYALLCALIVAWAAKGSTARQCVGAILALPALPLFKYLVVESSQSLILLFNYYVFFVVAGICACTGFFLVYFCRWTVASRMGSMIIFALSGPASLIFGSNVLIQDYALSRLVIEGTVSRLNVETWSKKATEYQVTIETRRFWATPQTFETLNVGDRILAEVGKGSQYIFKIERIAGKG